MIKDNSRDALFNPGKASVYFDGFTATIEQGPEFSLHTALTLAEISRVVYNDGREAREAALASVGLREILFLDRDGTQCAVIIDERSGIAVIACRGSSELKDWLQNMKAIPAPHSPVGNVHAGFKDAIDKVWDELEWCLDQLSLQFVCCGHSLGAALATIAASRLAAAGKPPVSVYKFGGPPEGDDGFIESLEGVAVHRLVNSTDIVGNLFLPGFKHAGALHRITADGRMITEAPARSTSVSTLDLISFGLGLIKPPKFLSNHSLLKYVTALMRLAKETQDA